MDNLPLIFAGVTILALVIGMLANHAHAQNNAALSEELDLAKEGLDASAHVVQHLLAGMSLEAALAELPHDPEAVDAFKRSLAWVRSKMKAAKAAALFLFLGLGFGFAGCSSTQLATTEADATALTAKIATAVDKVQSVAAQVDANTATVDDLAGAADDLAALVSSSNPKAAAGLRALSSAAKQAPVVAAQVGAFASTLKMVTK
jgi:hypothetical protein